MAVLAIALILKTPQTQRYTPLKLLWEPQCDSYSCTEPQSINKPCLLGNVWLNGSTGTPSGGKKQNKTKNNNNQTKEQKKQRWL